MSKKNKYSTYEEALKAARNRVKRKSNNALQEIPPEDYIATDTQQFLDDINLLCSLKFEELREVCLTDDFDKYDTGPKKSAMVYNKVTHLMFLYLRILYMNKEYTGDIIERMFECDNFHKKSENIEYMTLIYGREYALAKLKIKSDRVAGDKNPAHQHGGKYSAFSKNFIKYEGLSDEEIAERQKEVAAASSKTKQANPQNENTSIEYYTSRGMTEEEAIAARSERQSTFSLDKCIEKYGETDGYDVWAKRQRKWISSLQDKPMIETFELIRNRSTIGIKEDSDGNVRVYLFKLNHRNFMKFGVSGDVDRRIKDLKSSFREKHIELIGKSEPISVADAVEIETTLCQDFLYHSSHMKRVESYNAIMSLETVVLDTISESRVLRMWKTVLDDYGVDYEIM